MGCCRNRGFNDGFYPGCGNDYYYGAPYPGYDYNGRNGCNGYYPERYYPRPCDRHDEVVVDLHIEVPEHKRWY